MKLILISLSAACMAVCAAPAMAKPQEAFKGEALAQSAKVTLAEARATALKSRPGTIADQELEKEKGGSGLRYSFDIKSGAKTYEVGVDAVTGKILENQTETAQAEADEARTDAKVAAPPVAHKAAPPSH
jgi:hypothetical protein